MRAYTLTLPLLSGERRDALNLIVRAGLPARLSGAQVRVDAGSTLAATDSFADELVRVVLLDRRADVMVVDHVGDMLARQLFAAARQHAVSDRLVLHPGAFVPKLPPPSARAT